MLAFQPTTSCARSLPDALGFRSLKHVAKVSRWLTIDRRMQVPLQILTTEVIEITKLPPLAVLIGTLSI